MNFHKLRYLNVRSNYFREFPKVLSELPSLEILDISRNKIRTLPRQPGNLMNLKVLSISKNRIEVLPSYIGLMNELRILKIDHNPVVFPPVEVTSYEGGEDGMDAWLADLKLFLSAHASNHGVQTANDSDAVTTDDESGETDFNTISKSGPSDHGGSSQTQLSSSSSNGATTSKYKQKIPPPPIPTKNSHRNAAVHGVNSKSVSGMRSFQLVATKSPDMERSRSNSESDEIRRPFRRPLAMLRNRNGLGTLQEDRARHSRGFSHDYIQENVSEAESTMRSPAEVQQNSRAYFRRLSSLPQSKRISLNSAKVVEASRGILFSLSQIHTAVRQYVTFCADPELTGTINRVLYNANAHVGALVDVLEAHETRPEGADAKPVIEACRACVGAFRHVINILHNRVRDLTSQADVRYTRTLLLLLFGASSELQNSWACLNPLKGVASSVILSSSPIALQSTPSICQRSVAPPITRLKSNSNASINSFASSHSSAKLSEIFTVPSTPSVLATVDADPMETDDQLFEKISQATTATLALLSLLGDAVSKSALASAQGPATPGAVTAATNIKLKDLASNSLNAGEVTRRLKNKLTMAKMIQDVQEKKKFWEDTNLFVKAVINVAAIAKAVSSEYPFSKAILSSLSTVTRSTKELTILLSVSSFSQSARTAEVSNVQQQQQPVLNGMNLNINTPLSASLGPAQAVLTPALSSFPATALATGNSTVNRFEAEFTPSQSLLLHGHS